MRNTFSQTSLQFFGCLTTTLAESSRVLCLKLPLSWVAMLHSQWCFHQASLLLTFVVFLAWAIRLGHSFCNFWAFVWLTHSHLAFLFPKCRLGHKSPGTMWFIVGFIVATIRTGLTQSFQKFPFYECLPLKTDSAPSAPLSAIWTGYITTRIQFLPFCVVFFVRKPAFFLFY